jgi:hypothetical protein
MVITGSRDRDHSRRHAPTDVLMLCGNGVLVKGWRAWAAASASRSRFLGRFFSSTCAASILLFSNPGLSLESHPILLFDRARRHYRAPCPADVDDGRLGLAEEVSGDGSHNPVEAQTTEQSRIPTVFTPKEWRRPCSVLPQDIGLTGSTQLKQPQQAHLNGVAARRPCI